MYPQGRMSHHFREMRVGDYLAVKGPKVFKAFHYDRDWTLLGFVAWHAYSTLTINVKVIQFDLLIKPVPEESNSFLQLMILYCKQTFTY